MTGIPANMKASLAGSLMKMLPGLCAAVLLMVMAACSKEENVPGPAVFGGPAKVSLLIDGTADGETKAGVNVDETDIIHSIKVFAFKHDPDQPQHQEMVGFGSFSGLQGEGPHYCTMDLSASGNIDFYVIANDEYADKTSTDELDGNSTRSQLEGVRFAGIKEINGISAVPMTNIKTGETVGGNNFTFTVKEDNTLPQIIPVDVTRAMARLSFYFAKNRDITVNINSIGLRSQGPGEASFFSAEGSPSGYFHRDGQSTELLQGLLPVTAVNESGSLDDSALQPVEDATSYLLPNIYGSDDPDNLPASGDVLAYGYILDIEYSINNTWETRHKTVYLPAVSPNMDIKVKAIIADPVNINLVVIALSWTGRDMEITFN